jgi:hypothetical protein
MAGWPGVPVVFLVDHAAQPDRIHRFRHLRPAGYINPVTGQVHNAGRAGTQTLIGAVCFLIGAVLLPERAEDVADRGNGANWRQHLGLIGRWPGHATHLSYREPPRLAILLPAPLTMTRGPRPGTPAG